MTAGGGMVYWKNWIRLREAKKHIIKAFWWFKGDLVSQWIPKFYLCEESNPINPQCGKISANFYIFPPHPPHPQFYPQKWWKFRYTSWLTPKICISIDLRWAQVNNWCNCISMLGLKLTPVSKRGSWRMQNQAQEIWCQSGDNDVIHWHEISACGNAMVYSITHQS